jgi:hypothetical protein
VDVDRGRRRRRSYDDVGEKHPYGSSQCRCELGR